jgi:hypothetical protein
MNDIKGYTFFKSYYECLRGINEEEAKELCWEINKYIFENIEHNFDGVKRSICILIKPTLDKSKVNSNNAKKSKNETKAKLKRINKQNKNENRNSTSLSLSLLINNYFNNNKELIDIFNDYLNMRKKLKAINSERAIKTILNKLNNYDDETKYKMIEQSIVKSWKDIYELKEDRANLPNWFDKKIEKENITSQEEQELVSILKGK